MPTNKVYNIYFEMIIYSAFFTTLQKTDGETFVSTSMPIYIILVLKMKKTFEKQWLI